MVNVEITDSVEAHAKHIGARLRLHDRLEMEALGKDPAQSVIDSYHYPGRCWTVIIDGEPAIMFGVSSPSVMSDLGIPWLLGTDAVERVSRRFIRDSQLWVEELMEGKAILKNIVDARNLRSIAWLKLLGFTIEEPKPLGVNGELFHPFYKRAA